MCWPSLMMRIPSSLFRETSQRLAVARLLDQGLSYAAIEAQTGASATTIARVSKCLTYGSGGYEAALDILESQES